MVQIKHCRGKRQGVRIDAPETLLCTVALAAIAIKGLIVVSDLRECCLAKSALNRAERLATHTHTHTPRSTVFLHVGQAGCQIAEARQFYGKPSNVYQGQELIEAASCAVFEPAAMNAEFAMQRFH